jgi:hypothetical protein
MKKGGNAFDAMVAAELALAALQEILEVAVLWSTESQWRNRNLEIIVRKLRYGYKKDMFR